jgi:Arc/MetJ-type ribon-helix-helix transcriptional regulator
MRKVKNANGTNPNMKIITVNLPETYLNFIEQLLNGPASFPSRSELIRVAVREFLLKELEQAKAFVGVVKQADPKQEPDDPNLVVVGNKTYRIVNRGVAP